MPCKSKTKTSSPCGGKLAEFWARLWLRCHGYRILAANYRTGRGTHAGEIDIIAQKGDTIHFVEVIEHTGDHIKIAIYALMQCWLVSHCGFAISKTLGLLDKNFLAI